MNISYADAQAKSWAKNVHRPYEKITAITVENGFTLKVEYQVIYADEYYKSFVSINKTVLALLNVEGLSDILNKFLHEVRHEAKVPQDGEE